MVECDENGNIVVDYNPERVNALIQSRLNDPDISDGAKSVYNSMLPLSSDGSVDMSVPPTINSDGIIYTVGIAKTDAGSEFLVLTTQQGSIDNKSNCAGISLLGGQAGTLTGYETDIILRDEFTPSSANMNVNDVVTWGHRVTNENNQIQKTSNGNDMVSTDHVSRRLVSGKSSNGNELSRFINKNGYGGRARISVREGLDNARRSASQGLEKFGDRLCVVSFYTPKPKRVNPFNVHPNNR